MEHINNYINENKDRFINELIELLKIPSISADPAYKQDVLDCADAVAKAMKDAGADNIEICETEGYPIVYGEKIIDSNLPTVLVYGHYDVQPADPLELWTSGPFEPVIKKTDIHPEGAIFARGACDDKGQFYMHIKAFELMMNTGTLPCNVKFMIEGEEEVGSENLGVFVKANKERLSCDAILISDTGIIANDTPSITTGLRGLSYMEVEVTAPNRDLHSGLYGGAVANPINILCEMIAKMKDENNHITIGKILGEYEELSHNTIATVPDAGAIPYFSKWQTYDYTLNDKITIQKGFSVERFYDTNPKFIFFHGLGNKNFESLEIVKRNFIDEWGAADAGHHDEIVNSEKFKNYDLIAVYPWQFVFVEKEFSLENPNLINELKESSISRN